MRWIIMTFQSFKIQENPQTATTGSNDRSIEMFSYMMHSVATYIYVM